MLQSNPQNQKIVTFARREAFPRFSMKFFYGDDITRYKNTRNEITLDEVTGTKLPRWKYRDEITAMKLPR